MWLLGLSRITIWPGWGLGTSTWATQVTKASPVRVPSRISGDWLPVGVSAATGVCARDLPRSPGDQSGCQRSGGRQLLALAADGVQADA